MMRDHSTIGAAVPLVGALGAGGSSLLALGCCMAPAALVGGLTALGLGPLLSLDMGMTIPFLYATVGVSLAGIGWACWRARRWVPLAVAGAASAALLIPFHAALDVSVFYLLVGGGQATLMVAATFAWRAGRRCRPQALPRAPAP